MREQRAPRARVDLWISITITCFSVKNFRYASDSLDILKIVYLRNGRYFSIIFEYCQQYIIWCNIISFLIINFHIKFKILKEEIFKSDGCELLLNFYCIFCFTYSQIMFTSWMYRKCKFVPITSFWTFSQSHQWKSINKWFHMKIYITKIKQNLWYYKINNFRFASNTHVYNLLLSVRTE